MLKICLVFWESEPQYAYKRYAYKKKTCNTFRRRKKLQLLNNYFENLSKSLYFRPITRSHRVRPVPTEAQRNVR